MDAPLARRFASLAYEATLWAALVLVIGFLTLPLVSAAHAGAAGLRIPDLPARVLTLALVFAGPALYYVWTWTAGRRTLPMKTWRLRLVRADGSELDTRTALVRYFAAWTGAVLAIVAYAALRRWGLGAHALWLVALNYLWVFVDPERRFLHDRIAGTRLVADAPATRGADPVKSAESD
jgi:uncharacterized RDD family membrane protein YckC